MLNKISRHKGFSLIELMVAIAIVAVLAAIAVPSYTQFIRKGKWKEAEQDLVSLNLSIENYYRRTLSYPATQDTTQLLTTAFNGWAPSSKENFDFKYENTTTTTTATPPVTTTIRKLTATGTGQMAGCSVVLTMPGTKPEPTGC